MKNKLRITIITIILILSLPLTTLAARTDLTGWDLQITGSANYSQELANLGENRTVVVAVVDTGFSSSDPIFNDRILPGYNAASGNYDVSDTEGHGTAMASVIAYTTFYNPNIKIMPIKIDNNGDIEASPFEKGIEYAIAQNVDVINISIDADVRNGDSYVSGIESAIKTATNKGISVVVSSGNDAEDTIGWSPARMSNVICVGSINEQSIVSNFSNFGNSLDFVAPGENILTIRPDNAYSETGTSPAAASISGICALLKLNFPDATTDNIQRILQAYATDLGPIGWDDYYGWGLPNLNITPSDTSDSSQNYNNYIDIRNHWADNAIKYLISQNIVSGYNYVDGLYEFMPNSNITRAEFVSLLARMSGDAIGTEYKIIPDVNNTDWFAQAAYWAFNKGIVTGYEDGTFRPQNQITREEMAAMLVRYADYKGKYLNTDDMTAWASSNQFADDNSIDLWSKFYVYTMKRAGIINGDDYGNARPRSNSTRAETATMLYNFLTK